MRPIEPQDFEVCREIYGRYIDTSITFEYELPSREVFQARIESIQERYPYLVAESEGKVVGYAYAHEFKERTAYQWGAELSIYLEKSASRKGLGSALYRALENILRQQGVRTLYGIITIPNEPSVKLHESLGFSCAGVMRKSGFKNGMWRDVVWYEKQLGPFDKNPAPFKAITKEMFNAALKGNS